LFSDIRFLYTEYCKELNGSRRRIKGSKGEPKKDSGTSLLKRVEKQKNVKYAVALIELKHSLVHKVVTLKNTIA
jgi:hypothetical protein